MQEMLASPELGKLFEQRTKFLADIAEGEQVVAAARKFLAEVEAEIAEKLGVNNETPRSRVMTCSICEKPGHTKRTCPDKGAS
jgi:hypothetical protein